MLTVPQAFYSCWSILSQIYHFHTSTYSSSPNPEFKLPINRPGEKTRCRSPVSTASLPTISGIVVDQHGGCIVGIHQGIEALALTLQILRDLFSSHHATHGLELGTDRTQHNWSILRVFRYQLQPIGRPIATNRTRNILVTFFTSLERRTQPVSPSPGAL